MRQVPQLLTYIVSEENDNVGFVFSGLGIPAIAPAAAQSRHHNTCNSTHSRSCNHNLFLYMYTYIHVRYESCDELAATPSFFAFPQHIINPRRACAARVTVVVLCVCLSVCLFVYYYSRTTGYEAAYERYHRYYSSEAIISMAIPTDSVLQGQEN